MVEPVEEAAQPEEGFSEAERRIAEALESKSQELDLRNLRLSQLPESVGELVNLTTIRLRQNKFTEWPTALGKLKELEKIDLRSNALRTIPADILHNASLQFLYLEDNQLDELPNELFGLDRLFLLDIGKNKFTALPEEIGRLGRLGRLGMLYANSNRLELLPDGLCELRSLIWLDVSKNRLNNLPACMPKITRLMNLDVAENQLCSLGFDVSKMRELGHLNISHNQFTELPDRIEALSGLVSLQFGNNMISNVPTSLARLEKLESISAFGNPLDKAILDAASNSGDAFREILLAYEESAGEPVYEGKLLVTGEGKVGKSWLLAALKGEDPSQAVGEDNTTYGVDRGRLVLPHPEIENVDLILNTWDFGGQDVYRITHQFFFSEYALYLVVWEPRQGKDTGFVKHWLRQIELRTAGNAKVIVVATHTPKENASYQPDYGRGSLPKDLQALIVADIAVDSKMGDNIVALREVIALHASALPKMGGEFPVHWGKARESTLAIKDEHDQPYVKVDQFRGICSAQSPPLGSGAAATLAKVFMDQPGLAIFYGDIREGDELEEKSNILLDDIIVLDPEWLTKAFVRVLEDPPTIAAGGMLDHFRLRDIWHSHGNDNWVTYQIGEFPYLMAMMQAFDVSYVVPGLSNRKSMVAQLVPDVPPPLPWHAPLEREGYTTLRLNCELASEAPGLMAWFTVHTYANHVYELIDGIKTGLFWKEGVFLREDTYDNEALVTVSGTEKPILSIVMSGPQPGWFMGELKRTIDKLLSRWPGLKSQFVVPCNMEIAGEDPCTGKFPFEELVQIHLEDPQEKVRCMGGCKTRYFPSDLLTGFDAVLSSASSSVFESRLDRHLARSEVPCPRVYSLRPAETGKYNPRNWMPDKIVGKKMTVTLYSELSGKEVTSHTFKVPPGWLKYAGPLATVSSLILTGVAIPFSAETAQSLTDSAGFLGDVGASLPRDETKVVLDKDSPRAWQLDGVSPGDLERIAEFFSEIGVKPPYEMELAKVGDRWLWVTKEEAVKHTKHEADIPRE